MSKHGKKVNNDHGGTVWVKPNGHALKINNLPATVNRAKELGWNPEVAIKSEKSE